MTLSYCFLDFGFVRRYVLKLIGLVLIIKLQIFYVGFVQARSNEPLNLKFEYAFDIGGQPCFGIIQDRDGFIWFSSFFNGLLRYDGTNLKKYQVGPDGITEARNLAEELYGIDRLCEVVSRHWSLTAREIQQAVVADVKQYTGTQKVFDDITLLVLKQK